MKLKYWAFAIALLFIISSCAQSQPISSSPIEISKDGKLTYTPDANGDRVPDFSYCGYMASELPIPDVPVKVIVPAMKGDATEKIQSAIDYVSSLPFDKQGFRGAVLLEKGTFEIAGGLTIRTSGVVLRGTGSDSAGTILSSDKRWIVPETLNTIIRGTLSLTAARKLPSRHHSDSTRSSPSRPFPLWYIYQNLLHPGKRKAYLHLKHFEYFLIEHKRIGQQWKKE